MATKNKNFKQITAIIRLMLLCIFLNINLSAVAQAGFDKAQETRPLDSSIRYGRLANGFTYFLKSMPEPQSKLFLRFYNRAGSNQEDRDQINIAHAVEHLAFKATKNFPLGIDNSERVHKLGLDIYDITASSGRRNTEYNFDPPSGDSEALDVGLLWFRDIATELKLTDADIDQVRGELREEFLDKVGDDLNNNSAVTSMYSKIFPCEGNRSNFLEHHKNFRSETLRRFYRNWYRPDLLAISVVGKIEDLDDLERRIENMFGDIIFSGHQRKPKNCDSLYYSRPPQFVIAERQKDPSKFIEDKTAKIHMFFRDSITSNTLHSKPGMEELKKFQLLNEIVSGRLKEATNEYKIFDVFCYDLYKYKNLPPGMEIVLSVENGEERRSLNRTFEVLHQLKTFGVSDSEWKRLKEKHLNVLRQNSEEHASYWMDEISKNFNNGEILPTKKEAYLTDWLKHLTLSEFNEFVGAFLTKRPKDIGIVASAGHNALAYKEEEFRSWIEEAYHESVEPYKAPEIPPALMESGEVENLKEKGYVDKGTGKSGSRELMLDNGVKVVFKSSTSTPHGAKHNTIQLHGFALKGAKSFPKENFSSAFNAPAIVKNAGINGLDKFQLNRFLSTTSLLPGAVSPYIDYQETGIYGEAALEDLEIMMQLVYLYFTRPNKEKVAFEHWKTQEYKYYINPSYTPTVIDFKNAIRSHTGDSSVGNTLGRRVFSGTNRYKSIEKTDLDLAYDLYRDLFGNARDFTFLITGAFEIEPMLSLVQKYLGNLPNLEGYQGSVLTTEDVKELLKGPSFQVIPSQGNYKMENISYGIRFLKKAKKPDDWQEQLKVEALGGIITQKLWTLRYEKGYGLYDVYAAGKYNREMKRYEIGTYLYCQPEEFSRIQREVKNFFAEIKSGSISPKELEQGLDRMYFLRDTERAKKPRVMIQKLYNHYRYQQPWVDPAEVEKYVKSITTEDIVEVAKKYCREENFYEFVMMDKSIK